MADTLEAVCELREWIASRSDEIDSSAEIPQDIDRAVEAAGCYRLLVPRQYGGQELALARALPVIEELARADGSVGWVVGQVAQAQDILSCFPESTRDAVFGDGPDVRAAGAVAPKGRATESAGRWKVTGQWPFVTGCRSSSWLYLNCLVRRSRRLSMLDDGRPETRIIAVPTSAAEIFDTWHALGLRGTGSHDVRLTSVVVNANHTFNLDPSDVAAGDVMWRIASVGLIVAACVVGIAQGAVDELAEFASSGRRTAFSADRLAASPLFQDALGEAFITVRTARALLRSEAVDLDSVVRRSLDPMSRAALRAATSRVINLAAAATDGAYRAAGGAAVYDTMPLQRRVRDAHTAVQHVVAARRFYPAVGAILAGESVASWSL